MTESTLQPSEGCTLARYAEAKRLPIGFLRQLGLSDMSYMGRPAVRIPYFDLEGSEAAVRYRIAFEAGVGIDGRFRWRRGAKPLPYGLWRLDEAGSLGQIVLTEGESDAQTLWLHGVPALGLPGARSWHEEWAEFLEGIPVILVVIEPDAGGDAMMAWLAASSIRDRARLISLNAAKDPSGLYVAAPEAFTHAWRAAIETATPLAERVRGEQDARRGSAWDRCKELIGEKDLISHFACALERVGVAGEARAAKLIFLCLVSRLLDRPVSAAIKGPSAAGKSYLVQRVLEFFPATAYYALSAMSERALAYSDEPLAHRYLVLYEAAGLCGELATYFVRSLLSEGRLRYETVEETKDGLRPRLIERQGPTGLLVTTTALNLHAENETRLISIPVTDSAEQTQRVLVEIAEATNKGVDLGPWHALQEWLEGGEHRVAVPFAVPLARGIPPVSVRLRRDFPALLSLIRAHAILHQAHRSRDADGQIVATLDDYTIVRGLVADLMAQGIEVAVRPVVRETVEAVAALVSGGQAEPTVQAVASALRLDKSAAWRRVRAALEAGYLRNLEDRPGRPARLALAEPLPEDREILPSPERISADGGCTVAEADGNEVPAAPPSLDQLSTGTGHAAGASTRPHGGVPRATDVASPQESGELGPPGKTTGSSSESVSQASETPYGPWSEGAGGTES